jgi:hypothetical protein
MTKEDPKGDIDPSPLTDPSDPSPLLEVDPQSLDKLIRQRIGKIFSTTPLMLRDEDLALTAAYYRRERATFAIESREKEAAGPKTRRQTPKDARALLASDLLADNE